MHPALTYTLLIALALLFGAAMWIDGRKPGQRFEPLRRFSLIAQLAALAGAYFVLRPGAGVDGNAALARSASAGRPAFVELYSNF